MSTTENTVEEVTTYICERCDHSNDNRGDFRFAENEDLDGNDILCQECYEDVMFFECEDCGDMRHNHDMDGDYDYLCTICADNRRSEDDDEDTPDINYHVDETDSPLSEKVSLTSNRTFGIEFEMIGGQQTPLTRKASSLGFTHSGDGSVDGNGIEIQTSILTKGDEGKVYDMLEEAVKLGFVTNPSCGTHIHLGGGDFIDKTAFQLVSLNDINTDYYSKSFCIESGLLKGMVESFGGEEEAVLNKLILPMFYDRGETSMSYRMSSGKISRYTGTRIRTEKGTMIFIVRESTIEKTCTMSKYLENDMKFVTDTPNFKGYVTSGQCIPIDISKIAFYHKVSIDKSQKLKTLLHTYNVYNDFFFAMLPKERGFSSYCRPVSYSYSLKDINNCNSEQEIEKMWYKKARYADVADCKKQHYDDSRYHAINLHSLFTKLGTVEIRSHQGTLNPTSILLWVELHQRVLDMVQSGTFRQIYSNEVLKTRGNIKEIALIFIKSFGIKETDNLYKFIEHRLKKYSNITLKEEVVVPTDTNKLTK